MVLLQELTAYKGRQTQSPVTSPVLSPLCTLDTSVRKKLDVKMHALFPVWDVWVYLSKYILF